MTDRERSRGRLWITLLLACASLVVVGCDGDDGQNGLPGADSAILSGRVTNAGDGSGLGTATLTLSPSVPGVTITVDASGNYSQELPVGAYALTCAAGADYNSKAEAVSILAGVDRTLNFALQPKTPVKITLGDPGMQNPGAAVGLNATVTVFDGSGPATYLWTQHNSVDVTIDNATTATPTVNLPPALVYKAYIVEHLHMGELDRWQVLPIDPHAAEGAAVVEIECAVTTDSGTYTDTVEVHADLPFTAWTLGVNNVPINVPVLLGGRDQANYAWELDPPSGSSATLTDASTRYPYFTPDVDGEYVVTVFDIDANEDVSWSIYAGTYRGIITGQEPGAPGEPTIPTVENSCRACHTSIVNDWRATGHAHIFSTQIDTSTHYSTGCFDCHTVGFGTGAGGIDEASDFQDFLDKDYFHHTPGDNWTQILANEPDTAQLANIQCENCHGPQNSDAHMGDSRISLGSGVCASCHGEPPRHGRYQQWEESAHANYETAIGEGTRGSCARCHSAQGFLNKWEEAEYSLDENDIHPITCVVCHDPHNVGTVSGGGNNAEMREVDLSEDIESIGFMIPTGGKGMICMSCHNARRGAQNDSSGLSAPDRAPHLGTQTDVLFTQNAFFVDVGLPGKHAFLKDTCVTCHVELTPPPEDLSYQLGGTNHSFEAKTSICGECHGAYDPEGLEKAVEDGLHHLQQLLEEALYDEIQELTYWSFEIELEGYADEGENTETAVTITDIAQVGEIVYSESHGRQAMNIQVNGAWVYHVQLDGGTNITDGEVSYGSLVDNNMFEWVFLDDSPSIGYPEPNADVMPPAVILGRLGWNYLLLHADGSKGMHNPSFFAEILLNSITLAETRLYWVFD